MDNKERVKRARIALEEIKDYTQEQVDKLVYEAGKIIYKNAEELAKMAVEETGLGSVEDKIGKNTGTPAAFWDYLKDKKSVGIINEDPVKNIIEVAHPVGVIAGITPATNPTVTPLGNFMHTMKGRNALIICPAPRAKKTSTKTVNLIREALKNNGAPEDLIQIIEEPTIELSANLMGEVDLIIATGSFGLTKAAYSSGTPAYGVGPGNPPVIIDEDFDLKEAVTQTIIAVGSDNGILCDGILCDGDNLLLYPKNKEEELFEEFKVQGVPIYVNKEDVDKFREVLFIDDHTNPDYVGKDAEVIAKAGGFEIPAGTKIFGLKVDEIGNADVLCKEIMGPVVILKSYNTFEEAVDMAVQNMVEAGGIGHTAGIFSNNNEHIRYAGEKTPVARLLVNQPTPDAWGPNTNSLSPAVSESCGTWGNNILSENVDYIHMLNVSTIAMPLDIKPLDPDEVFAD